MDPLHLGRWVIARYVHTMFTLVGLWFYSHKSVHPAVQLEELQN